MKQYINFESCKPKTKRKRNSTGFFRDDNEEEEADESHEITSTLEENRTEKKLTQKEMDQLKDEGCRLAETGNRYEALKVWQRALNSDQSNAVLHELKAQVYLDLGRFMHAIDACKLATSFLPDWADGHLTLARSYRELGEIHLSVESYRTATKLAPENQEITEELREMENIQKTSNDLQKKYSMALTDSTSPAGEEVARCFLNLCSRASVKHL